MSVNLDDVGIQNWTAPAGSVCESVEYEKTLDTAMIPACDSGFGASGGFDPTFEFSIKGRGDLPAGFLVGSDGGASGTIDGVNDGAGTSVIESDKESEKNDDYNAWEISGTYFPSVPSA